MLEIIGLTKNYQKKRVLHSLTYRINEGDFIGFIGPNGAGKTTFISILSGLIKPSSGEILYRGKSIRNNLKEWQQKIGIVNEELMLFEHITIYENCFFVARLCGLSEREAAMRTDELIDILNLNDKKDTLICESSYGMKKKTAFALSIIHSPRFLFLDEAFTGIETLVIKKIKDILKLLSMKKTTIILSSHILDSIELLINRCSIINEGKIHYDAPFNEVNFEKLETLYYKTIVKDSVETKALSWL